MQSDSHNNMDEFSIFNGTDTVVVCSAKWPQISSRGLDSSQTSNLKTSNSEYVSSIIHSGLYIDLMLKSIFP